MAREDLLFGSRALAAFRRGENTQMARIGALMEAETQACIVALTKAYIKVHKGP